jgi:hypothetical protein
MGLKIPIATQAVTRSPKLQYSISTYSVESPCGTAAFVVNSEPRTGARPSVRVCGGLINKKPLSESKPTRQELESFNKSVNKILPFSKKIRPRTCHRCLRVHGGIYPSSEHDMQVGDDPDEDTQQHLMEHPRRDFNGLMTQRPLEFKQSTVSYLNRPR